MSERGIQEAKKARFSDGFLSRLFIDSLLKGYAKYHGYVLFDRYRDNIEEDPGSFFAEIGYRVLYLERHDFIKILSNKNLDNIKSVLICLILLVSDVPLMS